MSDQPNSTAQPFEGRTVTYVLTGKQFGIEDGYCVMGLSEEIADDD